MDELSQKFEQLPHDLKSWLLELVKRDGPNPMGEVLIRNTDIYKITYSLSQGNQMWLYTGQRRPIGEGKDKVYIIITRIYYDWVSSRENNAPTHVVMAQLEGESREFVHTVIVTNNYNIVCHPPESSKHHRIV